MNRIYKILTGISVLFLPLQFLCQEGTPEMAQAPMFEPPKVDNNTKEIYDPNGDYKQLRDGRLAIKGHHTNKVKNGEFTYYDQTGAITYTENYKNDVIHGVYKLYKYGKVIEYQEYYNGKKINYEYKFDLSGDTLFAAGPFPKDSITNGIITVEMKNKGKTPNILPFPTVSIDTIKLAANKPVVIHHYEFILEQNKRIPVKSIKILLRDRTAKSYTHNEVQSFILDVYNSFYQFILYSPSDQNRLYNYYNAWGKLKTKADVGYFLNYYDNGHVKDSSSIYSEGKVYQTGYDEKGNLLYEMRLDKLKPLQKTTLYYGANKKLLYDITSSYKPEMITIHDQSILKNLPSAVFFDCFGTAYFHSSTFHVDSSMTKLQYKYRNTKKINDGRYFIISSKGKNSKKMYRAFDIKDNSVNAYNLDSLLNANTNSEKRGKTKIFQRDSIIYYAEESKHFAFEEVSENYTVHKFLQSNSKIYLIHNRVVKTGISSIEQLLQSFEDDTLPIVKSELLKEEDFKKAQNRKSITKITKQEFEKWIAGCEAIKSLNDQNKKLVEASNTKYYFCDSPKRLYAFEFYKMGFNPYFTEAEFASMIGSLKLSRTDQDKAYSFWY